MMPRLLLLLSFLGLISCSKDPDDRIPEVFVDYRISRVEFEQNNRHGVLIVPPQQNAGVAGLVIYRDGDSYLAFDRCSSVNPSQRCAVVLDSSNLLLEDPCSGAKFSLFDGSPMKAPATRQLKEYRVALTDFNIIVRN